MSNDYLISVIYPDYEVATGSPGATRLGSGTLDLGHTGFAYVNGLTGQIRYFDYGRYSGTEGVIRETLIAAGTGFTHIDLNALDGGYAPGLGAALSEASGYTGNIQFNVFQVADGSYETLNQRIDPDIGNPNGFYGEWTYFNTCHNFVQDMSQLVGVDLDGSDGFAATPRGSAEALRDNLGGVLYNPETGVHWEVQSEQGMVDYFVDLLESGAFTFQEMIQLINSNGDAYMNGLVKNAIQNANNNCFLGETAISMWPLDPNLKPGHDGIYDQIEVRAKIWKKPIELIEVGDIVVSFDENDNLVPGPVTQTFQNNAKILLDFHGTRVTPGHVYYRPDSKKLYKYETLIDVLRDDGVIKHQDGTLIRAATNVPVGDPRDGFVKAVTGTHKADGSFGQIDEGRIRLGTRFLVGEGKERKSWSVADLIKAGDGIVGEDELIRVGDGRAMPFHWEIGDTLPKPEDFVLACSGTTLEDIYKAAEWESQGPLLPAPMVLDRGPVQPLKGAALSAMPRNEPLDVIHSPMASVEPQRTLNRKQRKAMEAKKR